MKNQTITAIALASVLFVSCNKEKQGSMLRFTLAEGQVREVVTKGNVSDYAALPAESDFNLVVKDASGKSVYSGALLGWDQTTSLAAGSYTASVAAGSEFDEGPQKPYFLGSTEFSVKGAETTSVSIPVSLGNVIVKVVCTESFRNYYPEYAFTLTTPDNAAGFDCTTNAVFVAYQFTVSGTVTNQSGKTYSLEPKTWKGDAATCYTVKYDVTNVGGASVTVSFSDSVQTVDLGEIELNQ